MIELTVAHFSLVKADEGNENDPFTAIVCKGRDYFYVDLLQYVYIYKI